MPKAVEKNRYVKKWKEEELSKAVEEVQSGVPLRRVCRKYPNIPRSTLQFRSSSKFTKSSFGPSPILNAAEEKELANWVIDCQKKGFPRRKEDVQISVKQFLDDNPRENPFNNNYPGEGWYKAFLKRHTELTERKSEAITTASSKISEADIRKWFSEIDSYLKDKGFDDILNFPERVFNGDETNFQLNPQNQKVLAPRGAKNVYEIDGAQAKTSLTVLFCFSASGVTTAPLIIYPYKRLPKEIFESVPEGFQAACSDTGWMKSEIFYEYIGNAFYSFVKKLGVTFPIILFVDGHKTHLDRKLSTLCSKLEIILVALYPNATRILQPADVSTFKPLKDGWRKGVLEWRRTHPTEELTKKAFAPLLKCIITTALRPDIIINGFRACGLYPWNPSAIQFEKCLGKIHQKIDNFNVLKFESFTEIVGQDRLNKFQNYDINQENDDLNTLYNLWRAFQKQTNEMDNDEGNNELPHNNEEVKIDIIEIKDKQEMFAVDVLENIIDHKVSSKGAANISCDNQIIDIPNSNLNIQADVDIANLPIILYTNGVVKEIPLEIPLSTEKKGQVITENSSDNSLTFEESVQDNNGLIKLRNNASENESFQPAEQVTHHNLNNSLIEKYLFYYDTPERKGTKNTERVPYIITSTPWKEIKDKKEAEKRKKIEEQKRRKTEREAKKIKKESEIAKKKENGKKKNKNEALLKSQSKKSTIIKNETLVTNNAENETRVPKKINIISNIAIKQKHQESFGKLKSEDENSNNGIDQKVSPGKLAKVTRKIFQSEDNNLSLSPASCTNVNSLFPFENAALFLGMCFACTMNITKENHGIKCNRCSRTYHPKCINKHNLHKSNSNIFTCLTCLKTC